MIVVVGSLNMDLVARVARQPAPGETVLAGDFARHYGGKGANQAVAARRMGCATRMIGAVGRDGFGDALIAGLVAEGIMADSVSREGEASGMALITVDDDGENTIVVVPAANSALTPRHLLPQWFSGARVVLLQLEIPLAAVREAARLGRAAGATVLLNSSPVRPLGADDLRNVDWILANAGEASALLGATVEATAAGAGKAAGELARMSGGAVITLGSAGVVWARGDGHAFVPALPVAAVDTTAAGDAFAGAFAVGLAEGLEPERAARVAAAAGALAVTRHGAQSSLPFRADVEALLGNTS